jgi:hypothetical protein
MLGEAVQSIQQLTGGNNNSVYLVRCSPDKQYVAKVYATPAPGATNRMQTEVNGLEFLTSNGVNQVAKPVAADYDNRCAVYEHLSGEKIKSSQVRTEDVDQAVEFLAQLKGLSKVKESADQPAASDACFSIKETFTTVERRLARFEALEATNPEHQKLSKYLKEEFRPALAEILAWCYHTVDQLKIDFDGTLAPDQRTLSPSDFGFHNALRRPSGEIAFLDFEYFGWDDPAKMIADFLLHPAMDLSGDLKQRFFQRVTTVFADRPWVPARTSVVYPPSGLKWCLIILNEFLPEYIARRASASPNQLDLAVIQSQQLAKSSLLLQKMSNEFQNFPYAN